MAMRIIEKSIPLSVRCAGLPGARNDYARLPSIVRLAETAVRHPMVLRAVGPYIADICNSRGYAESTLAALRTKVIKVMTDREPEAARATVNALKEIATDFASEVKVSRYGKPPEQIPGLFTSGITEAIVLKLLRRSGYQDVDITEDAFFYKADEPMSARNMDFVWAKPQDKNGAIYECKNQPARLVRALRDQNTPGHKAEWEKSELWLMLTVRDLLVNCRWKFNLSVVTLRPKRSVQSEIASIPFIKVPTELAIVCLEDLSCPL
jgi:hypothetical protein